MRDMREILDSSRLLRVRPRIAALARPSLRIKATTLNWDIKPGSSKFGGLPDLPAGVQWPTYRKTPTSKEFAIPLIAQIRLSDIAELEEEHDLPPSGWLWFFSDAMGLYVSHHESLDVYNDPRKSRVLYFADEAAPTIRMQPPRVLPEDRPWKVRRLEFTREMTLPDAETTWIGMAESEDAFVRLEREEWMEYATRRQQWSEGFRHRLLGYSDDVQPWQLEGGYNRYRHYLFPGEPDPQTKAEEQAAYRKGRLLFEIESHDDMSFGRWGCGAFFIRDEDLRARRFDRVWYSES